MSTSSTRAFLVVEQKSFKFELVGKDVEGLKLSDNGRGFRSSITFWKRR